MKKNNFFDQSGQIALVVLLVMIVMLTLGITVAQRGLFDVRISQQEEESSRAFQAAETGVEEALRTLTGGSGSFSEGSSYEVTVNQGGESGLATAQPIQTGETLAVDLAGASGLASVDVYWIDLSSEDCVTDPAAVEITIIEQSGPNVTIEKSGYDLKDRDNGFEIISSGKYSYEGVNFCGKVNVNVSGNAVSLRVRPIYKATKIGVDPRPEKATLAQQYRVIRSEGTVVSGATRAVEVNRGNPQVPAIFDYAVFSGVGLEK